MQQRIEEDYNDEIMEDIETAGEFIEPAKAYNCVYTEFDAEIILFEL